MGERRLKGFGANLTVVVYFLPNLAALILVDGQGLDFCRT